MNPMTCNEVDEQIEMFAAGECDPPAASAIRRHLSGCARCIKAEMEARQFLDMMNLRLQEPDRLQRLLERIENLDAAPQADTLETCPTEPTSMPRRRRTRSSRQIWFAIAASILLPIGIGVWLTPPAESPGQAQTQLTVALLPAPTVRGPERLVPAPAIDAVKQSLTFEFVPDGKSSQQYRTHVVDAAGHNKHVAPPEVHQLLQIHNPTEHPIRLRFDDERTALRLSLTGPGVLRVNAPPDVDPFAGLGLVELQSHATYALPITRLLDGTRRAPDYLYWTEPGEYHLRASLRVAVESANRTKVSTMHGPALLIRVK